MTLAVGIFVLALGVIVTEKLHRTKVALAGGVLIVASQTIEQERVRRQPRADRVARVHGGDRHRCTSGSGRGCR